MSTGIQPRATEQVLQRPQELSPEPVHPPSLDGMDGMDGMGGGRLSSRGRWEVGERHPFQTIGGLVA